MEKDRKKTVDKRNRMIEMEEKKEKLGSPKKETMAKQIL